MSRPIFIALLICFVIVLIYLLNPINKDPADNTDNLVVNIDNHDIQNHDDLYYLEDFTDTYPHKAFGSASLPTSLYRKVSNQKPEQIIRLKEGQVFETNRVLIQDIVGDEDPEILLTVSDPNLGSAEIIYSLGGEEIARSEYIGERFRWRHLLGVVQNQKGQKFIVDVVKPHLTGELTLYKVQQDKLLVVDVLTGYNSHKFGSSDLGRARIENMHSVIVPTLSGETHNFAVVDEKLFFTKAM